MKVPDIPRTVHTFPKKNFRAWLEGYGGIIVEPQTEWQVLCYRRPGQRGMISIYRNKRDRLNWNAQAVEDYRAYQNEEEPWPEFPGVDYNPGVFDLYTDAGHHSGTKAGSWGAVLFIPNKLDIEHSGPLTGDVHSSTSAEARGVANALHYFIKQGHIDAGARVRVLLDNDIVVKRINDHKSSKRADIQIALVAIRELVRKTGIRLSAQWIKGHLPLSQGGLHARMNRRCDALAKQHGRKLHEQRQKEKRAEHGEEIRI